MYRLPIGSLTSYTGYAYRKDSAAYDFDGTYLPILEIKSPTKEDTFQHTTDLLIDSVDGLVIVIGGNYYHDQTKIDGSEVLFSGALTGRSFTKLRTSSIAGYIDATYELANHLFANVGGRYTHERKVSTIVKSIRPARSTRCRRRIDRGAEQRPLRLSGNVHAAILETRVDYN